MPIATVDLCRLCPLPGAVRLTVSGCREVVMVAEKALETLGAGSLKQARDLLLEMNESKLELLRSKGYEVYFAKVGKAGNFP